MKHIPIDCGLTAHLFETEKFKTNIIIVLLRNELKKETASKNTLIAGILEMGCLQFKSIREISMECERMFGAAFEIDIVKKGEEQIIQLYMEVLKERYTCGEDLMEYAGNLLHSILFEPLSIDERFDDNYTDIQRERLKQKIKSKINDKKKYALDRCVELMCKDEPFGVPLEGYEKDIKTEDSESLFRHYENTIKNSIIEIGVIGSLPAAYLKDWTKKYFGGFSNGEYNTAEISAFAECGKPVYITESLGISQGKLVIGLRCPSAKAGYNFYTLLLFNEALGGGAGSRLFKTVREKYSLCYYINSFIYRAKSILIIQAGINESDLDKTTEIIKEQLADLSNNPLTNDELAQAKASLTNQFVTIEDSPQSILEFYMSNILTGCNVSLSETSGIIERITKNDITNCAGNIKLDTIYFLK